MLNKKKEKAIENHLCLHIWKKKEIENYLLIPKVWFRVTGLAREKYENFLVKFEALVEEEKDNIIDQISQHLKEVYAELDVSACNRQARKEIEMKWKSLEEKLSLVPGKKFIKKLNNWMRKEYGVSCSIDRIIKEIRANEVENEMVEVLNLLS